MGRDKGILVKQCYQNNFVVGSKPCGLSLQTITEGEDLEEAGEEVLCVRAFGSSYMALGISIRSVTIP